MATALLAALRASVSWLSTLPTKVKIVALAVAVLVLALLWAFHRGKTVGAAGERLKTDTQKTGAAMASRDTIATKVAAQTKVVAVAAKKSEATHAAAMIIDTAHVAVVAPSGAIDTVEVPKPVVARMTADSLRIAEQDSLLTLQTAMIRADSLVISDQELTVADLLKAPADAANRTSAAASVVTGVLGGAAIGAKIGGPVGAGIGAVAGGVIGFGVHVIFRR